MDLSSLILRKDQGEAMSLSELVILVGDKLACSCHEHARDTGQELNWQPV